MPLFENVPIDNEQVGRLAKEHWRVDVGPVIKVSQNHTFHASRCANGVTARFILRVTPDPGNDRYRATVLEMALLKYLSVNRLPACRAVASSVTSEDAVRCGMLILCLFTYATGEPVTFTDWTWMTSRPMVIGLGRWFARLHELTRRFSRDHPELVDDARHWTTLHDGVLAEVPVDPADAAAETDPARFGIIHGDVNPSNYFWDTALGMPCMFDWDQVQRSWFLYDLSAPVWCTVSLERAGSPIDRSKVPEANSQQFTDWLVEGYESDGERVPVDRRALSRMVTIRRELYKRFCQKAVLELASDHPMADFCQFMANFFENEDKESA